MDKSNMEPLVSLIVPVYNVETFLRKSLESVADQSLKNIEVILVNDGSTDGSGAILREFSERYRNFFLIEQENAGLSAARNTGLRAARGQYVAFLDSDDYLHPDYLKILYEAAQSNGADIACCNFRFYFYRSGRHWTLPFQARSGMYDRDKALHKLINDLTIHHFAWNKITRRTLFLDHGITFPNMFFEDVATSPALFYYAGRVFVTKKPLYNYTRRPGSILSTMNTKKINDFTKSLFLMRRFLEEKGCFSEYRTNMWLFSQRLMICNIYSVIRVHILSHNLKGMGKNLKRMIHAASFCLSKECHPEDIELSEFDHVVIPPENKNPKITPL